MADQDSSTIRIKIAQYLVNKKLQELESKNPPIKIDDWTYLQAFPQYGAQEPEQEPEHRVAAPSQLPPLFPIPTDDHISWNSLLAYDHKRLTQGGSFPAEGGGDSDFPKIPSEKPQFPPEKLRYPPWYCVAIIGVGVAGLRTAMLLQERGIPYKILEASERPGGRLFTYQFPLESPRAGQPPGGP
jgi:NAD(P)-binding Rossmann-like domain